VCGDGDEDDKKRGAERLHKKLFIPYWPQTQRLYPAIAG
jgi:hypothetical protein